MNLDLLIPLLITSIVTITGWFIVNRLLSNRDRANKRRDLIAQYLIEAWRKLENAPHRKADFPAKDLERAIADIQLFGTPRQIELACKVAEDFAKTGSADLGELLEILRKDLREELQLETVSQKIKHLRFFRNLSKTVGDSRQDNDLLAD